jgi:two-component system response regulator ResD
VNALKILVAEDDDQLRHDLGVFLQKHGFAVICVEDGYQALDYAVRETPDLLLLDVHMPAGDGFSVHERVARHAELALKPVIYMTRDPSVKIEIDAHRHGGFSLLHKPFEFEDLLETVNAALKAAGTAADADAA